MTDDEKTYEPKPEKEDKATDNKKAKDKKDKKNKDEEKTVAKNDCEGRGGKFVSAGSTCWCGALALGKGKTCTNGKIDKKNKDDQAGGVVSISKEELACDAKDGVWDSKTKTCKS